MKRILLFLPFVAVTATGCGTHSRYNPNDRYGDVIKVDKKDLIANLQGADAGSAAAAEREAAFLSWGKELFNDPGLGSNGQSCNSCHPGGGTTGGEARIEKKMGHGPYVLPIPNLVGAAARFPKYKVPNGEVITLQQMDNNCVRMFMAGKRLPIDSPESVALGHFVTSLSEGEPVDVQGGTR